MISVSLVSKSVIKSDFIEGNSGIVARFSRSDLNCFASIERLPSNSQFDMTEISESSYSTSKTDYPSERLLKKIDPVNSTLVPV